MTIGRAIFGLILLAITGLPTLPAMGLDLSTRPTAPDTAGDDSTKEQPILSADATWAGEVILVGLGLIVVAAYIGPIVQRCIPDELPPTHSHDEPPGTSGHHGGSGLANPEPVIHRLEDGLPHPREPDIR